MRESDFIYPSPDIQGIKKPDFDYCEVKRCVCLADGTHGGHRMCGHHIHAWRKRWVKLKDLPFETQQQKIKWIQDNDGKPIDEVVDKTYYTDDWGKRIKK